LLEHNISNAYVKVQDHLWVLVHGMALGIVADSIRKLSFGNASLDTNKFCPFGLQPFGNLSNNGNYGFLNTDMQQAGNTIFVEEV